MKLKYEDDDPLNFFYCVIHDKLLDLIFRKVPKYTQFREFNDEHDAKSWGQNFRKKIALTGDQLQNIYFYTGSWYKAINKPRIKRMLNDERVQFKNQNAEQSKHYIWYQ